MYSYEDWCKHYEYDSKTKEAEDDYKKYCENLDFFRAQLEKKDEE